MLFPPEPSEWAPRNRPWADCRAAGRGKAESATDGQTHVFTICPMLCSMVRSACLTGQIQQYGRRKGKQGDGAKLTRCPGRGACARRFTTGRWSEGHHDESSLRRSETFPDRTSARGGPHTYGQLQVRPARAPSSRNRTLTSPAPQGFPSSALRPGPHFQASRAHGSPSSGR